MSPHPSLPLRVKKPSCPQPPLSCHVLHSHKHFDDSTLDTHQCSNVPDRKFHHPWPAGYTPAVLLPILAVGAPKINIAASCLFYILLVHQDFSLLSCKVAFYPAGAQPELLYILLLHIKLWDHRSVFVELHELSLNLSAQLIEHPLNSSPVQCIDPQLF